MLSVLLSRNKSCTDPVAEVWMRSLCSTRAPTVSVVVEPPGGVPSVLGLNAVVVPICCATAGAAAPSASSKIRDWNFAIIGASSESGADRQVTIRERRDVRCRVSILQQRPQNELAPDRHFDAEPGLPFGRVRGGKRRDERIGRVVLPIRHARRRNDGPRTRARPRDQPRQPDVGGPAL